MYDTFKLSSCSFSLSHSSCSCSLCRWRITQVFSCCSLSCRLKIGEKQFSFVQLKVFNKSYVKRSCYMLCKNKMLHVFFSSFVFQHVTAAYFNIRSIRYDTLNNYPEKSRNSKLTFFEDNLL